ncbi:hypothetical protein A8B82_21055 [Sulfitobacter sp. EhC04]|nr:hypothetical protein A8B82_21055 [Sulfitobacter sp. EhC04]
MARGDQFPPVVVFFDGSDYHLADGYHRVASALRNQERKIEADVRKGDKRDAILFSVSANATHGHRRSNADKRSAVTRLLQDEEWSKWSQTDIAKTCNVSREFVNRVSQEIPSSDRSQDTSRKVTRGGTTYTINTANIGQAKITKEDPETAPLRVKVHHTEPEKIKVGRIEFRHTERPDHFGPHLPDMVKMPDGSEIPRSKLQRQVMEAAERGLKPERKSSNKNPIHKPNPEWNQVTRFGGLCREIAETENLEAIAAWNEHEWLAELTLNEAKSAIETIKTFLKLKETTNAQRTDD